MKFQNPSLTFYLNGRTHTRTHAQKAETNMLHFFKVGGHKNNRRSFKCILEDHLSSKRSPEIFVLFKGLRPGQHLFSHFRTASWV